MSLPRFTETVWWGADASFRFQVVDETTLTPLNTSSYLQFWFLAKNALTDADADAVITLTLGSGITAIDATTGLYRVDIPRSATTPLSLVSQDLPATIKAQLADATTRVLAVGQLPIRVPAKLGVT